MTASDHRSDADFYSALGEDDPIELYENAPCGYVSVIDGTIVKANRTFLTWTGYASDEVVGRRRFTDLLAVGDRIFYETHLAPLLRMQGRAREVALNLVLRDGSVLPVIANAVALPAQALGAPVTRIVLFDATERRAYERELVAQRVRAEASEEHAKALAHTLQASLLPRAIPAVPGLEIGASYEPGSDASMVGGDFYDVFEHHDGRVLVAVGDVVGKGPRAAALTGLARYTIRSAARHESEPAGILRSVADAFFAYEPEDFCTIVLASIGPHPRREVRIATGGHHLPLCGRADGSVETIGASGRLLGFFPDPQIGDATVALGAGDIVVMFTDGVVEAVRGGERYGVKRIARTLVAESERDVQAIASGLAQSALDFGGDSNADDVVVVAWRVTE